MVAHVEAQVLVLLAIAALVGMAARRYRMPYTIALTGAGLVLGFLELEPLRQVGLDGDLLMLLFLPAATTIDRILTTPGSTPAEKP